jgi:hypothetical protein
MGIHDRSVEASKLSRGEGIIAFCLQEKKKCDRHADGNEAVGEIEGWPVIIRPIDIEEIDDLAMKQSIDEISQRAAQGERQGGDHAGFLIA